MDAIRINSNSKSSIGEDAQLVINSSCKIMSSTKLNWPAHNCNTLHLPACTWLQLTALLSAGIANVGMESNRAPPEVKWANRAPPEIKGAVIL